MAGFSQSLEAKLGATKYARYRAIVQCHAPDAQLGKFPSVAGIQREVFADITVKVPRSTIRGHLVSGLPAAAVTLAGPSPSDVAPAAAASTPAVQINNVILMRENARLKKQLAEREAGWEIIRETLQEVYSEPLGILVAEPKQSELPGSPETAVLHVSDVHFGKLTPTYDIVVCEDRIRQVFTATSEITNLRRRVAPVDDLILLLGGDLIEGAGIFPSQAFETEVDLIQQMVKTGPEYCVNLILSLAQLFPRLRVHAVPGNHGRVGKFQSQATNADSVFYEIVRKMVQVASPGAAARVQWDLPLDRESGAQWYSRFNVTGEWGGMLVHGDQIQGQLGFPWYGVGKKVSGWNTSAKTAGFDYFWMGHFHTPASFRLNRVHVFASGSTESDNAYALENMASGGEPTQRISYFNARHGLLADSLISLR